MSRQPEHIDPLEEFYKSKFSNETAVPVPDAFDKILEASKPKAEVTKKHWQEKLINTLGKKAVINLLLVSIAANIALLFIKAPVIHDLLDSTRQKQIENTQANPKQQRKEPVRQDMPQIDSAQNRKHAIIPDGTTTINNPTIEPGYETNPDVSSNTSNLGVKNTSEIEDSTESFNHTSFGQTESHVNENPSDTATKSPDFAPIENPLHNPWDAARENIEDSTRTKLFGKDK